MNINYMTEGYQNISSSDMYMSSKLNKCQFMFFSCKWGQRVTLSKTLGSVLSLSHSPLFVALVSHLAAHNAFNHGQIGTIHCLILHRWLHRIMFSVSLSWLVFFFDNVPRRSTLTCPFQIQPNFIYTTVQSYNIIDIIRVHVFNPLRGYFRRFFALISLN